MTTNLDTDQWLILSSSTLGLVVAGQVPEQDELLRFDDEAFRVRCAVSEQNDSPPFAKPTDRTRPLTSENHGLESPPPRHLLIRTQEAMIMIEKLITMTLHKHQGEERSIATCCNYKHADCRPDGNDFILQLPVVIPDSPNPWKCIIAI
eukprot:766425-Hanusia_phi.AAC.5